MAPLLSGPLVRDVEPVDAELLRGDKIQPGHPLFGVVWINPNRVSGTPCFYRTRVPVQNLFDSLAGHDIRTSRELRWETLENGVLPTAANNGRQSRLHVRLQRAPSHRDVRVPVRLRKQVTMFGGQPCRRCGLAVVLGQGQQVVEAHRAVVVEVAF